jgi:hypothetical protein
LILSSSLSHILSKYKGDTGRGHMYKLGESRADDL